jgi:protein SCO1/2
MKKQTIYLFGAATLALAAGLWLGGMFFDAERSATSNELAYNAFVYPTPKSIPDFELLDHQGAPFDKARLRGHWSFVFFGYTHCPDVCPMTLDTFKQVHDLLEADAAGVRDAQFVFVSVDPDRDTSDTLRDFVTFFDPSFIGATGDKGQLDQLTQGLYVVYAKVAGKDPENYLMDHSAAVLLTNPDGDLHAVFTAPHKAADIAQTFVRIRGAAG